MQQLLIWYLEMLWHQDIYHGNEFCFNNVTSIAKFFEKLEFVAHLDKSVLISAQQMTILEFVINSRKKSVKLTLKRRRM